jgi:hypothetical protein
MEPLGGFVSRLAARPCGYGRDEEGNAGVHRDVRCVGGPYGGALSTPC